MKVVSPKEMNEIDSLSINKMGIPGIVLMENAAIRVVDEIVKDFGSESGRNVLIFAGKGNNGGDALAIARHLYNKGFNIQVYLLAKTDDVSGDAAINLNILQHMNIKVVELLSEYQIQDLDIQFMLTDLIIDGIFGTGIRGMVEGCAAKLIQAINNSKKPVLAIDIPSGINGENGRIMGNSIKAYKTVTFGLPKTGLLVHPGCEFVGELKVVDISLPGNVIDSLNIKINHIQNSYVSKLVPKRNSESNKGDYGKVLIVTGSKGMTGAGCLAAKAALRSGAGLVYLGVPSSLIGIYDAISIESITIPLEDRGSGIISGDASAQILEKIKNMDVVAVGPGMSVSEGVLDIVRAIVENSEVPVVLDADALNVISKNISVLEKLKVKAVITPHPGEMARLAGITIQEVQNNRINTAREFATKWKVVTVLKGAKTVIASPEGTVYINSTGNAGMATGGTGDVLAGLIAGLIAQGMEPENAAVAGVYIHGLAGDKAAATKGEHGLIAGDLAEELAYVLKLMVQS